MKKGKLALGITTYNRSEVVKEFLEERGEYYIDNGIDIYIYDSSTDGKTKPIVEDWCKRYQEIYYIPMDTDIHANVKAYKIFQQYGMQKEYEYLWMCAEYISLPEDELKRVMSYLDGEKDIVHVNVIDREEIGDKIYHNAQEYFEDVAWHTTQFGALILKVDTMLANVDWKMLEDKYLQATYGINYSHVSFYFYRLLEIKTFTIQHLSINTRVWICSKYKGKSGWYSYTIQNLCQQWIATVENLPEEYTNKDNVIKKLAKYSVMNNIGQIIELRKNNILTREVFETYKKDIPRICDIPLEKIQQIAQSSEADIKCLMEQWIKPQIKKLAAWAKKYHKVYIYGAGLYGKMYKNSLDNYHISYDGFCVSNKTEETWEGIPVFRVADLLMNEKAGFVLALNDKNRKEVMHFLEENIDSERFFFEPELQELIVAYK